MRAILALIGGLVISMGRTRVDPVQAEKAYGAVRRGEMSLRAAGVAFGVEKSALSRRMKGTVAMDARVGPPSVLSKEEEDCLKDILIYASRHFLSRYGADAAERRCAQALPRRS